MLSLADSTSVLISAAVWSAVAEVSIPSNLVPSAATSLPSTVPPTTILPVVVTTCDPKSGATLVPAIAADATSIDDLEKLIDFSLNHFGQKLDFILHSIGMSINLRKKREYTDLNHEWTTKGWDISALSFHKLLQILFKKNALKEWGSVIALSYIAAQRTFPNYNDMADNKAYLESVARSFGYYMGKERKVRVNTISQSCLLYTSDAADE